MYDGKYKWILVTLMYDKTFNQITVTERDVSHRYEYYEIIKRKNAELRKLLQTTEQYVLVHLVLMMNIAEGGRKGFPKIQLKII